MRYRGTAYRAHDPRWSFLPLSGEGAAVNGGRFNPRGVPALYLGLSMTTAVKEANQGLSAKIHPCVLCAYDVDCDDVLDLTDPGILTSVGATPADLACAWMSIALSGTRPASWRLSEALIAAGHAGVLAPSFAPGATADDTNLVLWRWSAARPHLCTVHDPSGRLPKNQLSWPG